MMDAITVLGEKGKTMRLIDADALIEKWLFRGEDGKPYRDEIDNAPTIEPKQGEWKEPKNPYDLDGQYYCFCSLCYSDAHEQTDFCPNCGADMRERNDDD